MLVSRSTSSPGMGYRVVRTSGNVVRFGSVVVWPMGLSSMRENMTLLSLCAEIRKWVYKMEEMWISWGEIVPTTRG